MRKTIIYDKNEFFNAPDLTEYIEEVIKPHTKRLHWWQQPKTTKTIKITIQVDEIPKK